MALAIEQLKRLALPEEFEAGLLLYRQGAVQPSAPADTFAVTDKPSRNVVLHLEPHWGARCPCGAFVETQRPCRHIVAATLFASGADVQAEAHRQRAGEAGAELLRALEPGLPLEAALRLEVRLSGRADGGLKLSLRIGEERLYVVRDMRQFLRDIAAQTPVTLGKGFVLHPAWMPFARADRLLLGVLIELDAAQGENAAPGKHLLLPPATAARVLRLLIQRPFVLESAKGAKSIAGVISAPLPLKTTLRTAGRGVYAQIETPADSLALTPDAEFVFADGEVLRLPGRQREVARLALAYARQGRADFRFEARQAERLLSDILPRLERAGAVELDGALAQRVVRRPLAAAVYLDREGRGIAARIVFTYGEQQIDPFAPQAAENTPASPLFLIRDAAGEQAVLDVLAAEGFRVRRGRAYLTEPETQYAFFTQGVARLQAVAEVYCSDDFRRMSPRRLALHGTLRLVEGRLHLELLDDGTPLEELLPLMQALREHKRYFVLRDGSMLDLTDLTPWEPLADALAEDGASRAPTSGVQMQAYRAAYLTQLLEHAALPVETDAAVQASVAALGAQDAVCPAPLDAVMRPYQQRGFAWLAALVRLGMGGILADDMGLGKTLQVIALLVWQKRGGERRPALVVAPSSLMYNWQAEFSQYAPELSVQVLEGPQAVRAAQLRAALAAGTDVLVTSYPLLRRDIDQLAPIQFSVAVLDEAQYIKNSVSVGAVAAGRLQATARFALTGTPMENHPGELWSLLNFVLPGYLGSLTGFLRRYGEGQHADSLRARLRPFLLRRLKRDVLKELPDKIETRLFADMTPEQNRVYQASLWRARQRVEEILNQQGLGQGRMQVLALLTELRLICCHPALALPDYSASSGKLDLLMDILPGALAAGHRALVFSQFTSMLDILQRRLEAQGITCLYLDGSTPNKLRLELVRRFNGGEGQVFLISLRAGGAGLNLTGADTVIHYDPWWNPAAEDQATDRAHRIGQDKTVQVIRLITHQSIEEQVVRLGERKRALFDELITAGERLPTQYTEDEIRALFDALAR